MRLLSLTAVFGEALVAELAETLEALVEASHFLLQVRVLLVKYMLFSVALRRGDDVLVDFCGADEGTGMRGRGVANGAEERGHEGSRKTKGLREGGKWKRTRGKLKRQ